MFYLLMNLKLLLRNLTVTKIKQEWDNSQQFNSTVSENNTATIMKIRFDNIIISPLFFCVPRKWTKSLPKRHEQRLLVFNLKNNDTFQIQQAVLQSEELTEIFNVLLLYLNLRKGQVYLTKKP